MRPSALRHLAYRIKGLLAQDRKNKRLCHIRQYIQVYVLQLIRHASNVQGASEFDSQRILATRLLNLDAVNILELMRGASSRIRSVLWRARSTVDQLTSAAQAPPWDQAWVDAMRSFPHGGIRAAPGHGFGAEDKLAQPLPAFTGSGSRRRIITTMCTTSNLAPHLK
jgi:hypothetical protein